MTTPQNNAEWLEFLVGEMARFLSLYDKQKKAGDAMAYDITWGRIVMLEELVLMLAPEEQGRS